MIILGSGKMKEGFRELSKEEKKISQDSLAAQIEELEYFTWRQKQMALWLSEGAAIEARRQVKLQIKELAIVERSMADCNAHIKILTSQLSEGVKKKEVKE